MLPVAWSISWRNPFSRERYWEGFLKHMTNKIKEIILISTYQNGGFRQEEWWEYVGIHGVHHPIGNPFFWNPIYRKIPWLLLAASSLPANISGWSTQKPRRWVSSLSNHLHRSCRCTAHCRSEWNQYVYNAGLMMFFNSRWSAARYLECRTYCDATEPFSTTFPLECWVGTHRTIAASVAPF